jgi:hypothetical protein
VTAVRPRNRKLKTEASIPRRFIGTASPARVEAKVAPGNVLGSKILAK